MAKKTFIAIPLALVVMVGAMFSMSHAVFAGATGGNCAPYQGLQYYHDNYCIYWESPPMYQQSGDFLYVDYSVNSTVTSYSTINGDVDTAAMNWTNSSHAKYSRVSSCSGSNCDTISGSYSSSYGFSSSDTCGNGAPWGWGDSGSHQIILNAYLFGQGCNNNGWIGLIAHEMGHTMGLDHNAYMYNGNSSCQNATYSMLMVGTCGIKVTQPQPSDYSALNDIYPSDPNDCKAFPGNWNCDGEDYIQEGCNAYAQSNTASDANMTVKLYYSTNCDANFTWGTTNYSNIIITKEDIERQSGTDGPAFTLTDFPGGTSWYTNMIYSPNNHARSCAWYRNTSTGSTGSLCTTWL